MNDISDTELVEKLKLGEESAYDELYHRYEKILFYMAMRLTKNKGDSEDAVQETFLQVIQSIHQLQNPAYLKLWMNRIISGKCKDIFRRNKTVPVDTNDEKVNVHYLEERTEFIPEQCMRFANDCEIMNYYIDRLPYLQKEAIFLAYFQQMSMQEIADITNEPIGTIKSRLFLAKKSLRTSLAAYESREKTRIDFHTLNLEALITASMLEGFQAIAQTGVAISAVSLLSKLKSLWAIEVGKMTLGVMAIGVVGTSAVTYAQIQSQNSAKESQASNLPHQSIVVKNKTIETDQDAYFVLMNWAMNEKQLQLRNPSEFETYRPLYEYLKEHKGPYWDTLITSGFSKLMEEKLK